MCYLNFIPSKIHKKKLNYLKLFVYIEVISIIVKQETELKYLSLYFYFGLLNHTHLTL